jgi:hypothetical protein
MSLFFQHIVALYNRAEYNTIKKELHDFEKTDKPFPN